MKIPRMHGVFSLFLFFSLSVGAMGTEALGYTSQGYWFQKVLVAETADLASDAAASRFPETYLPEAAPLEQSFPVPLPGPETPPLAETPDTEVQFSVPPKVPRNVEPALPPAPEPSIAGIVPPLTVLPPPVPPAGSSEPSLPPVLEPSIADLIPTAGIVPSVSAPPALPGAGPVEPTLATLPEPVPPPAVSPPGSIITVRPFTPPDGIQAPVQVPPPAVAVPAPVPIPEPPRFIRPAEPEPVPQIARQALPPQGNPRQEAPTQGSASAQGERLVPATYSRTVQAIVGQVVEIPFRGTGWIYLGEAESKPGIAYASRYLEKEGQNFLFHTERPGTYTLSFYKQDFIEDSIINDAVQVIVNPVPNVPERSRPSIAVEPSRVIAEPRWPTLPGAAAQAAPSVQLPLTELPLAAQALPEVSLAAPPRTDYLQQAREAYSAGQFSQAIASLDLFQKESPAGTDEAWWLYAQSLEAPGPSRDIRSALAYYHRLIREYPQSLRGNDARRRIAYLERYYVTIQ